MIALDVMNEKERRVLEGGTIAQNIDCSNDLRY